MRKAQGKFNGEKSRNFGSHTINRSELFKDNA